MNFGIEAFITQAKTDSLFYGERQMTVKDVEGKAITTIDGIAQDHPVKKAWISEEVSQCGYLPAWTDLGSDEKQRLIYSNARPEKSSLKYHI